MPVDVRLELRPVLLEVARDRVHGEVAERAQRLPEHAVADLIQEIEVRALAAALLELRQDLHQPAGADAARRALAARLVHVELLRSERELHHAAAVVDDDDRRRAEERARRLDRVVVHRRVDLGGRQHRNRRASGDDRLQLAAPGDAAGDVVDQLAQRRSQRALVVPGLRDVAREREDRGSGRRGHADLRELGRAELDDLGDERDRRDVVDLGRSGVEAVHRRERRPRARLPALAFERLEERGLLAADVGARAAMENDGHAAEQAGGARVLERVAHDVELVRVLASDVDEHARRADAVGGDQAALDEAVRRLAHDVAVLEGTRLGFVGVDDEVGRLPRVLREERGLAPHREARAAAPAQRRRADLVHDGLRLHPASLVQSAA